MKYEIAEPTKLVNSYEFFLESGYNLVREGDKFFIIGDCTEKEAFDAFAKHNPKEPTINEKLASVGLSIDDLKAALGI